LERLAELGAQGVKVCIVEAAILLEAKWREMVDEVWVVVVPVEVAKARLMTRNNFSEEEALKRIKSQMSNGCAPTPSALRNITPNSAAVRAL
jgi:dephospho-CoA kinase